MRHYRTLEPRISDVRFTVRADMLSMGADVRLVP